MRSDTVHASGAARLELSEPVLAGNEWRYVKECLDSGWVSSAGPFVGRFERAVAEYAGAPHAVAAVNGTAALHAALLAVGVQPGDEVLVSDLTFIAPVNAVRYCGAHPVLVDAARSSWQMDPAALGEFLAGRCDRRDGACYDRVSGRRVRAVVPVHILGLACAMDRIMALAREHHLRVVEDAAEAMGVRHQGRHAGTFGDAGVFSFNGNKVITSGGGGMIVTADERLAARARYLTTQAREESLEYVHQEVGYNYRLTGLQAALGLAQLEQLDGLLEKKRRIGRWYAEALRALRGVELMPLPEGVEPTFWLYTMLLPSGAGPDERNTVLALLHAEGIMARPLWRPAHAQPPYEGCRRAGAGAAEDIYARAISLPSGAGLGAEDVARVAEAVGRALDGKR
jgi:perosamine synthetase